MDTWKRGLQRVETLVYTFGYVVGRIMPPPLRGPHPNPWNLCVCYMAKVADGIRLLIS